jgi:hypothetical protein
MNTTIVCTVWSSSNYTYCVVDEKCVEASDDNGWCVGCDEPEITFSPLFITLTATYLLAQVKVLWDSAKPADQRRTISELAIWKYCIDALASSSRLLTCVILLFSDDAQWVPCSGSIFDPYLVMIPLSSLSLLMCVECAIRCRSRKHGDRLNLAPIGPTVCTLLSQSVISVKTSSDDDQPLGVSVTIASGLVLLLFWAIGATWMRHCYKTWCFRLVYILMSTSSMVLVSVLLSLAIVNGSVGTVLNVSLEYILALVNHLFAHSQLVISEGYQLVTHA